MKIKSMIISILLAVPVLSLTACFDWLVFDGYELELPSAITIHQGETISVEVGILAQPDFEGAVTITIKSTQVTAEPITILADQKGVLKLTAKEDAKLGEGSALVYGSSEGERYSQLPRELALAIKPKVYRITGQVQDYTSGEAQLEARLFDSLSGSFSGQVAGRGTLQANGDFELELLYPLTANLQPAGSICEGVVVEPETTTFAQISIISVLRSGVAIGTLQQISSLDPLEFPKRFTSYTLTDKDAQITGNCQETQTEFSLYYTRGWNLEMKEISSQQTRLYTIDSSGLSWRFQSFE
jgi:hypothetical protein